MKGFMLGRLLERRPQLEPELLTFRDHLLAASSSSEDQMLKVILATLLAILLVCLLGGNHNPADCHPYVHD